MSWVPEQDAKWANQVYKDLTARGIDAEAALKECGIRRTSLKKKNATIPFEKHCALFGYAAQITGEEYYGLHLGTKMDPRDAGLVGYLGLASATLREAIENLCRYNRVASNVADLDLTVADGVGLLSARLNTAARPPGYDQQSEFSVSLFLRACRIFTQRPVTPLSVHFGHPRNKDPDEFRRVLNCPVEFGHDRERVSWIGRRSCCQSRRPMTVCWRF